MQNKDDVIGIGSFSGWTRGDFADQYLDIRENFTIDADYFNLLDTAAKLYVGCSDQQMCHTFLSLMKEIEIRQQMLLKI